MFTKAAFIKSLTLEAKIIKHLVTQIPKGQLDWRATPPQRSTLELLRYLSYSLFASAEYAVIQVWDRWEGHAAGAKDLQPAGFAKAMDKQIKALTALLADHDDAALQRTMTKHWTGTPITLGEGLMEMVLKPAVAYRMQLFLQAKASGAAQLSTSDCWQGKPMKVKKVKPAKAAKKTANKSVKKTAKKAKKGAV